MTDTMGGGRGGVGIRLYTSGGEVVKRTFDQVGDSGKKMWAQIALGEKAANPALRAMSRASGEAQTGIGNLAGRAGAAGNVLGAFGATGVGVAAALGGLILALNQTKEALSFADALEDSAAKVNIGVEALQLWRFAAVEAGGAATDADSAIDGFQKKLGEAMAGGRAAKWFERLGFGGDDLKAFASTEEALDSTIRAIAALGTEAERAAVSEKLGLGPLIPLIRQGGDAIDDMMHRARELGVVMDESMVKRGAEANREMEILSQVIDLQLKQAFIDLAPVLLDTLKFVGWLAEGFRDAAEAWKTLDQRSTDGLRDEYDRHQAVITRMLMRPGVSSPNDLDPLSRRQFNQSNERMGEISGALARRAAIREPGPRPGGNSLIDVSAPTGGSRTSPEERAAEQRRREAQREIDGLQRKDFALQRDLLKADTDQVDTAAVRAANARLLLSLDEEEARLARDKTRAAIEAGGLMTEEVRLQLENLDSLREGLSARQRAAIDQAELRELAAERLATEKARDEDAIALMELDQDMARSAQERVAIARRILLAQQALELKILEASLAADGTLSDEDVAAIDRKRKIQGREVELFDQNQRDDLRAQFQSYGHEVVSAIESGRIGEHIGDQLKARLIDMALNGLFDFLNPQAGGGNGGGGSIWSMGARVVGSLFGFGAGPGRAGGGSAYPGTRHAMVETGRPELLMIGGKGQVTSAAETVRLLRQELQLSAPVANAGRMADGALEVTISPSREFHATVRRTSREEARQAAAMAGTRAVTTSLAGAPQAVVDNRAYRE